MNPQDPLAALHPLRSPELIGWWPPAPGWWIVLAASVLAMVIAAVLARRRYTRNAYRRHALHQLERAQRAYQADGDASHYMAQVNALLKSVALLVYPRNTVAASHGGEWRAFLNRGLPDALQLQSAFDDAAYQKNCPDLDLAQVHLAAQHWIRKHRASP